MITFSEFAQKNNLSPTDQLVGYSDTSIGGEKRWSYSTLLNAVSTETLNQVTGTSPISVSNGNVSINTNALTGVLDDYFSKLLSPINSPTIDLSYNSSTGVLSADVIGSSLTTILSASPMVAKAWVEFKGTGTVGISADYNVSSITDNANGSYQINFAVPFSNTDYTPIITATDSLASNTPAPACQTGDLKTLSALEIKTYGNGNNTPSDADLVSVVIFGN